MPFRKMIVRPIVAGAILLGLTACANLASPGEELWPYGYGAAEGPNDQPRLVTADGAEG